VLYCVLKLHTVISTLRWAVLTVLWIGFCLTGPISLCVDLFVFFCFILHSSCISVSTVGWTWWDWSLILWIYLPSVLWHCWLGHLTHKNPSPIWPIMCLPHSINQRIPLDVPPQTIFSWTVPTNGSWASQLMGFYFVWVVHDCLVGMMSDDVDNTVDHEVLLFRVLLSGTLCHRPCVYWPLRSYSFRVD